MCFDGSGLKFVGYLWMSLRGFIGKSPMPCYSSPAPTWQLTTSSKLASCLSRHVILVLTDLVSTISRKTKFVLYLQWNFTIRLRLGSQAMSCYYACCSYTPRPMLGFDSRHSKPFGTPTTFSSHSCLPFTPMQLDALFETVPRDIRHLTGKIFGDTAWATKDGDGSL